MQKAFLETYTGQSTAKLIALEEVYRIDSLVLAFEQAIQDKPDINLSKPERFILAIEAMEREVNNGGWAQFFSNTDNEYDAFLVEALEAIGSTKTAGLAAEALSLYQRGGEDDEFEDLDSRYFELAEPIAERLFQYITSHQSEIELPGAEDNLAAREDKDLGPGQIADKKPWWKIW